MEIESVAVTALKPYPNNPRKGNVETIAKSLEAYGQYKPITVNRRNQQILAGNHTFEAAKSLGWEKIDVVYVDVDKTTAAKIVAIDNKASDDGYYDNDALMKLLGSLPDLEATGYSEDDLDDLKALLEETITPPTVFNEPKPNIEGASNAVVGAAIEDFADRYSQRASRMLVMDFPNDTYVWIIEKLMDYRAKTGIPSNADAILDLIEKHYGEIAPK